MIETIGQSFGKMFNTSSFTLTKFLWSSSKPATVMQATGKKETGLVLNSNEELEETEKAVESNVGETKNEEYVTSKSSKQTEILKTGEQQNNENNNVASIQGEAKGERWRKIRGRFSGPFAKPENISTEEWHKLQEVLKNSPWRTQRYQRLLARMRSDPEDMPIFKEFDFV